MQQDRDQPIDQKIRCPRDGVVMHKFRVAADSGDQSDRCGDDVDVGVSGDELEGKGQHTVVLDRCHVCRGFWVDLGELGAVLGQASNIARLAERQPPPRHSDETLNCPRCCTQLIRLSHHQQHHLKLDTCTVCGGIFFDAQELTDLSAFTLLERIRAFFD
jgi:uncharacterized protein